MDALVDELVAVVDELVALVDELVDVVAVPLEALVDVELLDEVVGNPPQTLVLGMHTRIWSPLASAIAMHERSDAHGAVGEHVGAQYWSPAN